MRTISIFLALFSTVHFTSAQIALSLKEQYESIHYKQQYVYNGIVRNGLFEYINAFEPLNGYDYAEEHAYLLVSYLEMFEATGDKAYLVKFVQHSMTIMAWRQSDYTFNTNGAFEDGMILWAFAKFIHLIQIKQPVLKVFELDPSLITIPNSTIQQNEFPYGSAFTMETYSQWLVTKTWQTFYKWYYEYWDTDLGFEDCLHGLNQQSGFACAMMYMGDLPGGYAYWWAHARVIINNFKNGVDILNRCESCQPQHYSVIHSGQGDSYWWHHAGWDYESDQDCFNNCFPGYSSNQPDIDEMERLYEDISHGMVSLEMALVAHEVGLSSNGVPYFTDYDMVRFHNTLTSVVWNQQYGSSIGFSNNLLGTDYGVYPPAADGNSGYYNIASLVWMKLSPWDNFTGASGDPLYDIVMSYFSTHIYNNPMMIGGAKNYLGLTRCIDAQWRHECFNLTLFNRELPYDQDFAARHVLTIDPAGEAGMSFADPRIPDARFTVMPGVRSTHRAGSAVIWEPGFEASYESVVEAVIDPLGCDLAYRAMAVPSNDRLIVNTAHAERQEEASNEVANSTSDRPVVANNLDVVPNPSQGNASAWITLVQVAPARIRLIDSTGRQVWEQQLGTLSVGEHRISLPSSLGSGIYLCRVDLANTSLDERVVVE